MPYSLHSTQPEQSMSGIEPLDRFWDTHPTESVDAPKTEESGIPLDFQDGKVAISNPETHCMICGASGLGKTRRMLYPAVTLSARAGRSMVIADLKGEIYRHTANEVRRCGHDIKVINLRNPWIGDRFSPLSLVERYWKSGDHSKAIILLKDISEILTAKLISSKDSYWMLAAQDSFIGFAILILERGWPLTLERIHRLFNRFVSIKEERLEMLENFQNGEYEAQKRLSTILNLATTETESTLACILSEFNTAISAYVDQEDVRDLLSCSDIELTDIVNKPTAVYLVCPDESTALYGIASLFVEQTYSELIRFADSREDNKLPIKVDFVLDEFGNFICSDWPAKLTAARSRGIRFILALQSMSQLISRHGDSGARTLLANCRTLVYLGGRDLWLMEEISKLSGRLINPATGATRPVLSITDLNAVRNGCVVVLDDSEQPYIGHVPDWEQWGIDDKARLSDRRRQPGKTDDAGIWELFNSNYGSEEQKSVSYPKSRSIDDDEIPF